MKKKTTKLALVEKQNSDEQQVKREEERKQIEEQDKTYKLTRAEIHDRVRKIRQQFEMTCDVYRGAMFNNCDMENDLNPNDTDMIDELAGWLNPQIAKLYKACCIADKNNEMADNAVELYFNCLSTAYQLGVFMGVIVTTDSPAEIDKAEKGLIFISAAQPWVSKQ